MRTLSEIATELEHMATYGDVPEYRRRTLDRLARELRDVIEPSREIGPVRSKLPTDWTERTERKRSWTV